MSEKTYMRILTVVLILGALSVGALLAYTFWLAEDCSIISYIAQGR